MSTAAVDGSAYDDYGAAPRSLVERAARIAAVCERHGVELPAAIRYPLRHPAVTSVVAGMRTAEHVRGNVARYRAVIPEALWEELHVTGLVPDPARTS